MNDFGISISSQKYSQTEIINRTIRQRLVTLCVCVYISNKNLSRNRFFFGSVDFLIRIVSKIKKISHQFYQKYWQSHPFIVRIHNYYYTHSQNYIKARKSTHICTPSSHTNCEQWSKSKLNSNSAETKI